MSILSKECLLHVSAEQASIRHQKQGMTEEKCDKIKNISNSG
jgi:hypothetical protein